MIGNSHHHSLAERLNSVFKTAISFLLSGLFCLTASPFLFAQNSADGFQPVESVSDVRINEILTSNNSVLQDEDGEYSDWIEIHNSAAAAVNLNGWYLSDDSTKLKKWQFPSVNIPAGGFLIVFASDKDRTAPQLHTNFKLTADGEFLALTQPDTTMIASQHRPAFPAQASDISFGVLGASLAYFSAPTPGAANGAGTVDLALSGNRVDEHSPDDTYIGTFITTDMDTAAAVAYSLLDDAGGRFKISGNELLVADSALIDFDADTSHQITARTTYGGGSTLDRVFTIFVNKVYSMDLLINEFLASNSAILQDEDGEYSDWIEIYNAGSVAVNLENWYITDSDGNLTKWQFPARNLPAGGYLVIFASDKNRTGAELHTNFKLSASGEYLGLVQPNGSTIVSQYAPQYPSQTTDISYGLFNGVEQFFDVPTPGSANTDGTLPVDPLGITPERGFYDAAFSVTISTGTPGAEIRYTLDGSKPTPTYGIVYSGPVSITTTTVLRAVAYKTGYRATRVETHTYLFLDDVIQQPHSIPGYPIQNYSLGGSATVPHDYEMDPVIVNDPAYSGSIIKGLRDIPSMVIAVDPDSLFGSSFFYDGTDLEQRVSMELLNFQQPQKNEQLDCGVEGHSHLRLKRSLRLSFRAEYGSANWDTPLFEDAPLNGETAAKEQKRIVLRGGNNRSWARKWNPDKTAYTEDQWFRDSQIAMSGYGSHGNFVHLYINGIYWGLYNAVERPDHHFSAAYFGGDDEDWFATNHDGTISGDDTRFDVLINDLVNNNMSNPANYAELQEYLDVDNFIDYMMLNWYGAVTDWPGKNYWGGNRNNPIGPFRFYCWDAEWSWDVSKDYSSVNGAWVHPEHRGSVSGNDEHSELWQAARDNTDFMMRFADRVYDHCFNGGALTDSSSLARWDTLNEYVRDAIIAESAKWGDCQEPEGEPLRTRDEDWQDEVDAIAAIMDGNVARFILALRAENYYPGIDPPLFSQRGGEVQSGFSLALSNPNGSGTIYYTSDGSDPRTSGGGISGSAQVYSSEIILSDTTAIKTRVREGSEWSALNEALFLVSPDLTVYLKIKVLLEGPYNSVSNEMSTALNAAGNLPLTSPYPEDPRTLSAMPPDISAWVLLQLRNSDSGAAIASRSALLRKDGLIVGDDGATEQVAMEPGEGSYYVVIKHRNHLAIMSAAALTLSKTTPLYDFSTSPTAAYGTDPLNELEPGVYGMPSGDGDGNGAVDSQDREAVWQPQNGSAWSYSKGGDFNLDGGIDAEDLNRHWRPNQGKTSEVPGASGSRFAGGKSPAARHREKTPSKSEVKPAPKPAADRASRQPASRRRK